MSSNTTLSGSVTLDPQKLPRHIAIIMDGNGRWAKKRLLNRINGHEKGVKAVRAVVEAAASLNIAYLTLYAFSTENWNRPRQEVEALMRLLRNFLISERPKLVEENIRLKALGQVTRLPKGVQEVLLETMEATKNNSGLNLNLALSYGSRTEITEMVKHIGRLCQKGDVDPDDITEAYIAAHLYTRDMPDPDILIRTSGEMRFSNFLLWQIAYSELFVTPTLWPDFNKDELLQILEQYQHRDRRFGKLSSP